MTIRFKRAALVSAFCLLVLPLGASADQALDRARSALEQNNAAGAYAILQPLEEARAGDPEFDYLLGISALDAGYPTEAVFALERVLALEPDNDLARAEIARAYYVLGERETSRREFETVRDSGQAPEAARQTIDTYLALLEQTGRAVEQEGTRITGYLEMMGGYDSNINSATDQSRVALPILGNVQFQLIPDAQEQGNAFGQLSGSVNISHPLAGSFRAIAGARATRRETDSPFGTQDAYAYAGLQSVYGKHRFTAAGTYENFELDGDTLRNVYGGFGQWTYGLDDRTRLNLSVQGTVIEYINLPSRDVDRFVFSGGWIKALDRPRAPVVFVGAYGGMENEHDSDFPQFGHDFYGGRIGGSLELRERTRGYLTTSIEQRDYNGADTIFLKKRDDTQFQVSAGVNFELDNSLSWAPEVAYINNDSNIPLNDYDRWVVSARLRYTF
ncbi:MAG: tetratricopeptide repeat protein [Gammaproteobacteria bacterium]